MFNQISGASSALAKGLALGFLEDLLMLTIVVAFVAAIGIFGQDIAALALALQGRV